ncbi:MAG: phosphotransferase [Nitrospiraceae bacterium]|nr:MAG: phosphotransferase [Nitrospiraceae bacterium]
MKKPINVFILAAGFGERLRPITNHIPKPLLPVLGKPILHHVLERVSALSIYEIALNLSYKKEEIGNWIVQSPFSKGVTLFPEQSILGTGGALKNAEQFLGQGSFLVHNSDILSDIDLQRLLEFHGASKNIVTLAVHDCERFNTVLIDKDGFFAGIKLPGQEQEKMKKGAFTGIAVYEPEFLKFLPDGPSSIVDTWIKAVSEEQRVGTLDVSGCLWSDIGTPSSYASTVFHALKTDGEMVFIHPSVQNCGDLRMEGSIVMEERSRADKGASLSNCIMLPGGHAEAGVKYEHCIIGPGFVVDCKGPDIQGLSGDDGFLIGTGGSDRKYYRKSEEKRSLVIMQCTDEDPDFERHIEYTRFFLNYEIPVPQLIKVETDKKQAIFEDLGDFSLYSWLKCPRPEEDIERMFKSALDILLQMHSVATDCIGECPLLQERVFDYDHFRWETAYFIERFVEGIRDRELQARSSLDRELHRLAEKADSFPKTIVHRDFQSQNIMIAEGDIPRLIDFQGARVGPPGYDVVSILWDPYYCLEENPKEELLDYYIQGMIERSKEKFIEEDFRKTLLTCRLQRHMQALGAYGFLSSVKGKKYFLKHITEGLRLLKEDSALSQEEYPQLYKLVESL